MSNINDEKNLRVTVEEIADLPDNIQAEKIADQFSKISNEYAPLLTTEINIEDTHISKPFKLIEPYQVYTQILCMKSKASTVVNDIPMKIIKEFGVELSNPLADILNRAIVFGEYPDSWKLEIVTPVPKKFPPASTEELRKISGLKNFSKIAEKFLAEYMMEDMKNRLDPSQYGNQKGVSINHYLIKLVNKILNVLNTNSAKHKKAIIMELVDWSQAFDRQCPKLGVQSFIKNGVRKELIPILVNYFQNRKMIVKWHENFSTLRDLPGGGPQGATLGILEYLSLIHI